MNRIGQILREKGIGEIVPSEEVLNELGIKMQTWNKFAGNRKDPDFHQIPLIAKFLGVEIEDLFVKDQAENVTSKHRLITV
jgi:transcriptional regulator with XRE-family HTH domain